MFEHRQVRVVEFAAGGFGLIVGVGDVADEEVDERVLVLIDEIAVGVAPFAIVLVERAVGFVANHRIVRQGHTTALTVQRLRRAKQRVDRHAKLLRQHLQHLGIGLSFTIFPTANSLTGYIYPFCKLLLSEIVFLADAPEYFFCFHF